MVALFLGILFILFAVYSVLPVDWSLGWWADMIEFLKGGLPILALFIGFISIFVGIADIKDRIEAKREEEAEAAEAAKESEGSEASS